MTMSRVTKDGLIRGHAELGRSQRRWYRRLFGQSVLDRLLRTVKGVDVVVADTE